MSLLQLAVGGRNCTDLHKGVGDDDDAEGRQRRQGGQRRGAAALQVAAHQLLVARQRVPHLVHRADRQPCSIPDFVSRIRLVTFLLSLQCLFWTSPLRP